MKKKCWLAAIASLAAGIAASVAIVELQPPEARVTKANFERIENGMTELEVQAILGAPSVRLASEFGPLVECYWIAPERADGRVIFLNGRAVSTEWIESPETFTDKLRRWLGLPRN